MRALLAVQELAGREVVTVANAGGYSTIACRLVGMTPVYADIEEASQLASLPSLVSAIGPERLSSLRPISTATFSTSSACVP